MALLRRRKQRPDHDEAVAPETSPEEDTLTAYDAYGRPVTLARSEYRERVLPAALRNAWDQPAALYSVIVQALRDGFTVDLLDASDQLLAIDPDAERAATARGIVLLKCGELDAAEGVLRGYLDQHGPSGVILTNLAKVDAERGDGTRAWETLRQALRADPNLENGLLWWIALARETGGDEAYQAALEDIASVPGSWRPQLWLARNRLERGDTAEALVLYRDVLARAGDQSDALLMVSGDLGNAGRVNEVLDLVLPRYVPDQHAVNVGFNLVNACIQAGRRADGEALVHSIGLLNAPHVRSQLASFARTFDEMRARELGPPVPTPAGAPPAIIEVPRPLWHTYLSRPDWLLPADVGRGGRVAILTVADGSTQHRDVARAFPLMVADRLLFTTDAQPFAILPVVRGVGPAVPGQPWPTTELLNLGRSGKDRMDYVVSTSIAMGEGSAHVLLELWDVASGARADELSDEVAFDGVGPGLVEVGRRLVEKLPDLGKLTRAGSEHALVPGGALLDGYASAYDQLLTMSLAREGLIDAQRVYGRRDMLEGLLNLSLHDRDALLPKLLFLCGLELDRGCGSEIYLEFRTAALAMADAEKDPASDAYAMTSLAYRLFGLDEAFAARRVEVAAAGRTEVAAWLGGGGQPAETQPESQPAESHPVQAQPAEAYPEEAYTAEGHPAEAYPAEAYPAEGQPAEGQPAEAHPEEAYPAEAYPAEAHPAEAHPEEAYSADAYPEEAHYSEGEFSASPPAEGYPAESYPEAEEREGGAPEPESP